MNFHRRPHKICKFQLIVNFNLSFPLQVLDDGGGSSDEGEQHHPSPMETNHDIAPPSTFKGKSWLTEPNPHPSTQVLYKVFLYLSASHVSLSVSDCPLDFSHVIRGFLLSSVSFIRYTAHNEECCYE